jgi:DNA polymerase elongation subunit (family B)
MSNPTVVISPMALLKLFPKHIFHKIACIGALVAERSDSGWEVRSLGAAHVEERSEAELIQTFVDRINDLRPCLVSFNGASFDLPVLRYRAMMNRVAAPGLECRWRRRSRPQSRSGETRHLGTRLNTASPASVLSCVSRLGCFVSRPLH